MLVGAEAAELAGGRGVLLGGAPAAVVDVLALDAAVLALERGEAPAAEVGDAELRHPGRARLHTLAVEQVPAIAALRGQRAEEVRSGQGTLLADRVPGAGRR